MGYIYASIKRLFIILW